MSVRLGLEVTPTTLRGVLTSAWSDRVARTLDVACDPSDPVAAVAALRAAVPAPDAAYVTIGLGFLHVARVELPPSGDEAREAMVQLEPSRFLAVDGEVHSALAAGSSVALAVDAAWLDALVRALSGWTTVERIEASPIALAAALSEGTRGTFAMDVAPGERGMVEVRDGRLMATRRMTAMGAPSDLGDPPATGVPATHVAALGAIRRDDAPLTGTLMSAAQRRAARRRSVRRLATAMLAAAAGVAFLLVGADRFRERTLAALEAEATRLTSVARPALDAQVRLALGQQEGAIARSVLARRSDPASALAAIGALLPRDVVILSTRVTGDDWQVDGTARDAAALVPLLDADPRFDNVRSLAASSRFRDGAVTRESFSIALHVRPAS